MARRWIAHSNGAAEERLADMVVLPPTPRLDAITLGETLRLLGIEDTGRLVGALGLEEARRQLGLPLREYRRLAEMAGALTVLEAHECESIVELACAVCCAIASLAARP